MLSFIRVFNTFIYPSFKYFLLYEFSVLSFIRVFNTFIYPSFKYFHLHEFSILWFIRVLDAFIYPSFQYFHLYSKIVSYKPHFHTYPISYIQYLLYWDLSTSERKVDTSLSASVMFQSIWAVIRDDIVRKAAVGSACAGTWVLKDEAGDKGIQR